jgi:Response regulator receiver domain
MRRCAEPGERQRHGITGIPGARALVVEDDRGARQAITAHLRREGFHVLETGSGLEALSRLRRCTVDIALVDAVRPEIAGLEAGADDYVVGAWVGAGVIAGAVLPSFITARSTSSSVGARPRSACRVGSAITAARTRSR